MCARAEIWLDLGQVQARIRRAWVRCQAAKNPEAEDTDLHSSNGGDRHPDGCGWGETLGRLGEQMR